jgi:hypothetical protein
MNKKSSKVDKDIVVSVLLYCITADFATAASQNRVCITQQICHIMILFHDCSVITDEHNNKIKTFFAIFLYNIAFL